MRGHEPPPQKDGTLTTRNSSLIADSCTQRIEGLNTHVPPKTEILVNGASLKLAHVTAIYQASLKARSALKTKRNEAKVALQEWTAAEAARASTDKGLKSWVIAKFGADSQAAKDMGFTPAKVPQKSVETKQTAVKKMRATREARHTMGKKKRLTIKGTVTDPTAPAPPAINVVPAAPPAAAPQPAAVSAPAPVNGVAPAVNGIASH